MGWYGVDGYHADDDDTPTRAEAEADYAQEKWDEKIENYLDPLVDAAYKLRTEKMTPKELEELDEDALIEELEEDLKEEAEEAARDSEP